MIDFIQEVGVVLGCVTSPNQLKSACILFLSLALSLFISAVASSFDSDFCIYKNINYQFIYEHWPVLGAIKGTIIEERIVHTLSSVVLITLLFLFLLVCILLEHLHGVLL